MRFSVVTILAFAFCLSPAATVTHLTPDNKYEYVVNDDSLTVTLVDYHGEGGVPDLPERIDGRLVTHIGFSAFQDAGFTGDLVIPKGVRVIEERAFQNNPGLTSVTIPPSVKMITSSVFWQCPGITNVYDHHIYPDIFDPPTFHECLWYYTYNTYAEEECFAGPDNTVIHIMKGTLPRHLRTQPPGGHSVDLFMQVWHDKNPECIVDDIELPTELSVTIPGIGYNVVCSTTGWVVPNGLTAIAITWSDISLSERVGDRSLELDNGTRFYHRGWDIDAPWFVNVEASPHRYTVGQTVPMGTAVLVHGQPGRYTATLDYSSTLDDALQDNLLHGRDFPSVTDYPSPGSATFAGAYTLGWFREGPHYGFFWDKIATHFDNYDYMHPDDGGQYVAEAHQPWLTLTTTTKSRNATEITGVDDVHFHLTFLKDLPTAIESVDIDTARPKSGQRYNMMGLPVAKDYKGIVIEDGKIIIVR